MSFWGSKSFHHVIRHHSHINGSTPLLQCSIVIQHKERENFNSTTSIEETDKWRLTKLPVSTASTSFVFQCLAMFSESGSSGFGALRSAWMLYKKKTIPTASILSISVFLYKNTYLKSLLNNANSYIVAFSKGISIFSNFTVGQSWIEKGKIIKMNSWKIFLTFFFFLIPHGYKEQLMCPWIVSYKQFCSGEQIPEHAHRYSYQIIS